jgi:hypothetical protein
MPVIRRETLNEKPDWLKASAFGMFRVPKGGEVELHYHDADEIWFIVEGRARVVSEGQEYGIGPGELRCTAWATSTGPSKCGRTSWASSSKASSRVSSGRATSTARSTALRCLVDDPTEMFLKRLARYVQLGWRHRE